jgi:hypothetical protein
LNGTLYGGRKIKLRGNGLKAEIRDVPAIEDPLKFFNF